VYQRVVIVVSNKGDKKEPTAPGETKGALTRVQNWQMNRCVWWILRCRNGHYRVQSARQHPASSHVVGETSSFCALMPAA
jgi:hypothetical protein